MALFIKQEKPKDFDCGYHLELMIEAITRISDENERIEYANRIVEVIKKRHRNWVYPNGDSPQSWDHFFEIAAYNPEDYGIKHPFGYPPELSTQPS
jgi:hypothetical protein